MSLVMEYVQGLTLALIVKARGSLAHRRGGGLRHPDPEALGKVHQLGIVHRHIKPLNLIVTAEGVVKVMDFGIAKMLLAESLAVSGSSVIIGTPRYMSPEQTGGMPATARSDFYAVTITLYELLAGQPPFDGPIPQVLRLQLNVPPDPIIRRRPDVPPALARIRERGLEKDPTRRFASAEEMRWATEESSGRGPCRQGVLTIARPPLTLRGA